jgi:hypothetical protein
MIGCIACSSQKKSVYLSESYSKDSEQKLEQALKELNFSELNDKKLKKLLDQSYKKTRTQAVKQIRDTEVSKSWTYKVAPDTTVAFISYVPTQTLIISQKLLNAFQQTDSIDLSPLWYHYWAHHELGHLQKRTEAGLATRFGGVNRVNAIQHSPFDFIKEMMNRTGAFSTHQSISPFSIDEEEQAELLASKAWITGRKDSIELKHIWRTIQPEFSWAEDYFRMHMGKIKMVN